MKINSKNFELILMFYSLKIYDIIFIDDYFITFSDQDQNQFFLLLKQKDCRDYYILNIDSRHDLAFDDIHKLSQKISQLKEIKYEEYDFGGGA